MLSSLFRLVFKATGDEVTLASIDIQICPAFVVSIDVKLDDMSRSMCGIPTDNDAFLLWPASLCRRVFGFGVGSESDQGLLDTDDVDVLAQVNLSEGDVTWDDEVIVLEDLVM
jgi:hypothetical protein